MVELVDSTDLGAVTSVKEGHRMAVSLDKVSFGIQKYCAIMDRLHQVDVSKDAEFQRLFNGYYRMRQRTPGFYQVFYEYLEQQKNNRQLAFHQILTQLYEVTGILTPSFSSKLLATVRPEMPVWDRFVLKNLGLQAPYYYDKNRVAKMETLYEAICDWYQTNEATEKLNFFNAHFPNVSLTDTKKIDLILWQTR